MPSKNTKKKRDSIKYPGLEKRYNSRIRQEHLDQDYIDQLSEKEKEFLSNFNEEFYGGNFYHRGKKLHKSKKSKRACYSRNNAQNRCGLGISKAKGNLVYADSTSEERHIDVEDALIDYIDSKKED